jgi:hypothetical protein
MLGFAWFFLLKSQVFSGFLFLSYQSAIGQANRRRAERLELSPDRHKRTFPNFPRPNLFRVGPTIGKYDEAGNVARLDYQFALPVSLDALLNFSRNFNSRADKL